MWLKKLKGIFRFFRGVPRPALAKTTAKASQRRHKDGTKTGRTKESVLLSCKDGPVHTGGIQYLYLQCGRAHLCSRSLRQNRTFSASLQIFAKICKDAAKTPFLGRVGLKISRILWGPGFLFVLEFYRGRGFPKKNQTKNK